MEPEMYWVVGPNSNVGKTTLATALISVLAGTGRKTLGFKPYGARKFIDIIDLDCTGIPAEVSKVFGMDAVRLASASNVASLDDIELISPVVTVSFPEYANNLVTRAGARIIRNADFYRGKSALVLEKRADYRNILEELGIRDWLDFQETELGFPEVPRLGRRKVEECFRYLLKTRDVETVVCEGAGRFLPFWDAEKVVNHIVFIQSNEIYLFRDIDLNVSFGTDKLLPVQNIVHALRQKSPRKAFLPFSRSARHDEVARETVERLLGRTA